MTALLWARPIFAAILVALVGLNVWTACALEANEAKSAKYEPPGQANQQ
jgi:hypothetical protein